MPTLSFILSGLLVGAGSIYLYLSQTDKIEKTKQKITESNKITYLSKKSSLTLSSVKNMDTNNSLDIISTTNDKLSNFVAKDDDVDAQKLVLIDRCQQAVEKIIKDGGIPNQNSISSCKKLKNQKFNFYGLSSNGVSIPEKSILKKDKNFQKKFTQKIKFASLNEKVIDKKIQLFKKRKAINKKIESIKNDNISKVFDRINRQKLSRYRYKLAKYQEERRQLLSYKKTLSANIVSLKNELAILNREKDTYQRESQIEREERREGMFGFFIDRATKMSNNITDKMLSFTKKIDSKKSDINKKEHTLISISSQISSIDKQIEEYQRKINQLQGQQNDK